MQNLKKYKLHIAGGPADPASGEWFESVNRTPYALKICDKPPSSLPCDGPLNAAGHGPR